jgi:glycine/D-amino acid oxidase-like deaminating enzyme
MAAGSGRALADMIMGRAPAIDMAPYALERFN